MTNPKPKLKKPSKIKGGALHLQENTITNKIVKDYLADDKKKQLRKSAKIQIKQSKLK